MAFANRWLRYLDKKGEIVYGIELNGDRSEGMDTTDIHVGETVKQTIHRGKGEKIPDQIKVKPTPVGNIKIETSGGNTYLIYKGNDMAIRHAKCQRELDPEEVEELKREAKKHGYNVVDFKQTST